MSNRDEELLYYTKLQLLPLVSGEIIIHTNPHPGHFSTAFVQFFVSL